MINPLFEEDMEFSNLVEDEFNGDTLSYYCNKLDFSSSICDGEYSNDVALGKLEDEVLDRVVFENQRTLHSKFYDNSYEERTN